MKTVSSIINDAKALVGYLKKSGLKTKLPHAVHQKVKVRCNSHLGMLLSIAGQIDEMKTLLHDASPKRMFFPFNLNQENLKTITDFLMPIKKISDELEKEKEPTIHRIYILKKHMILLGRADPTDSAMTAALKERFTHFLLEKFKIQSLHKVAVFLDPKFKSLSFMEGSDLEEVLAHVQRLIEQLGVPVMDFEDISPSSSFGPPSKRS